MVHRPEYCCIAFVKVQPVFTITLCTVYSGNGVMVSVAVRAGYPIECPHVDLRCGLTLSVCVHYIKWVNPCQEENSIFPKKILARTRVRLKTDF